MWQGRSLGGSESGLCHSLVQPLLFKLSFSNKMDHSLIQYFCLTLSSNCWGTRTCHVNKYFFFFFRPTIHQHHWSVQDRCNIGCIIFSLFPNHPQHRLCFFQCCSTLQHTELTLPLSYPLRPQGLLLSLSQQVLTQFVEILMELFTIDIGFHHLSSTTTSSENIAREPLILPPHCICST